MAERTRSLRKGIRETTPEYNIELLSKAGGRITKTVKAKTSAGRPAPYTATKTDKKQKKDSETRNTIDTLNLPTHISKQDLNDNQSTAREPYPPVGPSEVLIVQAIEEEMVQDTEEDTLVTTSVSTENHEKPRDKGKNIVNQEFSFRKTDSAHKNTENQCNKEQEQQQQPRLTKITAKPENLQGDSTRDKIRIIKEKFSHIQSFKYARTENYIGEEMITALFSNFIDARDACNTNFTDGHDNEITPFSLVPIMQSTEALSRTIRIWDIPTNFNKKEIALALEKYGPLINITMQKSLNALEATATFQNKTDYENCNNEWAIFYRGSSMRIFPYYATRAAKETRTAFSATLAQLPKNTTATHLAELINKTHAKTCYIPKNSETEYKRLAILTFATQEILEAAKTQKINLGDTELKWINKETKVCSICSSTEHLYATCQEKHMHVRTPRPNTGHNNIDGYRPPQFRRPNPYLPQQGNFRSYADALRTNTGPPTATHDLLKDIRDAITELMGEIKGIKKRVAEVEDRLEVLEKETDEKYTNNEDETSDMEEDGKFTTSNESETESERTDLARKQRGINTQLNKMENLMKDTITAVNMLQSAQGSPIPEYRSITPIPSSK
jgi:hypothetical protein